MLKQLYKLSRRVFILQKAYSLVNILGLAIGIAICLMIFRVVEFNTGYDSFQPDIQHIFNPGSRDRQPERSDTEDQERTVIGLGTSITF